MSSSTSSSSPAGAAAVRANLRAVGALFGRDLMGGVLFAGIFFGFALAFVGGVRGTSSSAQAWLRSGLLALLALATAFVYLRHPRLRPCFRAIVVGTALFLAGGEVYFRLATFGPDAVLHFWRYLPASVDYPLCPVPVSEVTWTGFAPEAHTLLKGARFETNAFGFRDRERSLAKPPGTVRIVVVGASQMMGAGVEQDAVFTSVLEDRLNARNDGVHYEVLNLSRGAYQTVDFLDVLAEWGMRFDPDLVVVKGNGGDRPEPRQVRRRPPTRLEVLASLYHYPYSASFFAQAVRARVYYEARNLARRVRLGRPLDAGIPEHYPLLAVERADRRTARAHFLGEELLDAAGGRPLYFMTLHPLLSPDLRIYIGDGHPSARAHARWARELEEGLDPMLAVLRQRALDTRG